MDRNVNIVILATFIGIFLSNLNSAPLPATEAEKSAYFLRVEYPKIKIYQTDVNGWSFSVDFYPHNAKCSEDLSEGGYFFFKIYENDGLWWNEYNDTTYHVWWCSKDSTVQHSYQVNIPLWMGPRNYRFKAELYWYHNNNSYLQDITSFTVSCVVFIHPRHQTAFSYLFVYLFTSISLSLYISCKRSSYIL